MEYSLYVNSTWILKTKQKIFQEIQLLAKANIFKQLKLLAEFYHTIKKVIFTEVIKN